MEFVKNGYNVFVEKNINESIDMYHDRGWFIVSQLHSNPNLDEVFVLSKIWINIKYKNCKYNPSIFNKIRKMEKNIKVH